VPLPGMGIELVDGRGQAAADGEPGEILVTGSGVARGYLNRPALTAERFVVRNGRRAYRSGDLAVRLPGGEYGYLGRIDDQMKVRGFRIEPGEVESVLAEHPAVGTAILAQQDFGDGDVRLIAYLVAPPGAGPGGQPGAQAVAEIAAMIRERLPAHAWPSSYRVVKQIPVTSRGKADRAGLANLRYAEYAGQPDGSYGPDGDDGMTDTERAVSGVVMDVMRGPRVSRNDELFDRGVTSLAFMRILTCINQMFGTEVTGAELDEASIAQLASCVDEQLSGRAARSLEEIR
jgi:AMP-binding enzyme/phosphopantetheine binding protein